MSIDRVYMDSCCFIESIKSTIGNAQSDRQNDLWYIQSLLKASKNGDIEVITSYLTIAECKHAKDGNPTPSDETKRLIKSILSSGKVIKLAQLTKGVAEKARDLHWDFEINLSGADSIHVATALITGCKEFITFDYNRKKSPIGYFAELKQLGLKTIEPSNTLLLPATYLQKELFEKKESESSPQKEKE